MINELRIAIVACCCAGSLAAANAAEPLKVDTSGVKAKILYEAVISGGHLPELKGKYKLRVTEITIGPGGHVGSTTTSGRAFVR